MDKNLVAVDRHGTLMRIEDRDPEHPDGRYMILRPGLVEGLRAMAEHGRVVLTSREDLRTVTHLPHYLKSFGFEFDGVYSRHSLYGAVREQKGLSRVYNDFGVRPRDIETRVVTIEDIMVDTSRMNRADYEKIVIDHNNPKFCSIAPYRGKVPIAVLVPNPSRQSQNWNAAIHTRVLADVVDKLYTDGEGNFLRGYEKFSMDGVIKLDASLGGIVRRYLAVQGGAFPASAGEIAYLEPRVLHIDASSGAVSQELLSGYKEMYARGEFDAAVIMAALGRDNVPVIEPPLMKLIRHIRRDYYTVPVIIVPGKRSMRMWGIEPNKRAIMAGAIQLKTRDETDFKKIMDALGLRIRCQGTEMPDLSSGLEDELLDRFGGWKFTEYQIPNA